MEPEKSVATTSTEPVRVLYCESNTDGTVGGSHYCSVDVGYERQVSDFSLQRYMHDIHGTYDAVLAGRPLPAGVPLTADGQP